MAPARPRGEGPHMPAFYILMMSARFFQSRRIDELHEALTTPPGQAGR